jgi:hypothetical protein
VTTKNALGIDNGTQLFSSAEEVARLKQHISTYTSKYTDLREPLRRIEQKLLYDHAGFLVGNQCVDFQKQDGITEIEESIMANAVERNLNDLLLREELVQGHIQINRQAIYVSCVSNFTNFLDLFRKSLRSLEVGIPCIILGRTNTVQQHSYRWTKLLVDLLQEESIDPGMVTYLSCSLDDIKDITQSLQEHTGNLYATCSRELAANMTSGYPNTIASTGGPNTLVTLDWTRAIQRAVKISATIESSGQCTALRHCIVPPTVELEQVEDLFSSVQSIETAPQAVKAMQFDGVFAKHAGSPEPPVGDALYMYHRHNQADAFYKVSDTLPASSSSSSELTEYWRKVVVDFTRMDVSSDTHMDEIAAWLNTHQPISLAMNANSKQAALDFGLKLFEKTGMVVNTIGWGDQPAMTCQARPQEAEVFGEFPPRRFLSQYTKYPVVVPSSTPSYDTSYAHAYLESRSKEDSSIQLAEIQPLLDSVSEDLVKGYCVILLDYLKDATQNNPKRGFGSVRTALWGLQRPPLGTTTHLRCNATSDWNGIAPLLVLFSATNASEQLQLSVDPNNTAVLDLCKLHAIRHVVDTDQAFDTREFAAGDNVILAKPMEDFPMVGQFVSTLFPLGHIKSTQPDDEEFIARAKALDKWLKMV